MVVSTRTLAAALRLGDGESDPVEPLASVLELVKLASEALIEARLDPDREAPEALRDEATIRVAAYLYDQPHAASGQRFTSAWYGSGASALLAPWARRRAGAIG